MVLGTGEAWYAPLTGLLALLLAGCVESWCACFGLDCSSERPPDRDVADRDGDVWPDDQDCDDQDPLVHPNAEEVCDGVDNDCDGETDEGTPGQSDWHPDEDKDGYGDAAATTVACGQPHPGWVMQGGDCDDGDPAISPSMPEVCDGIDNDCDGADDDEDSDDSDLDPYYADLDGDGYGGVAVDRACELPAGRLWTGGDCDDSNASTHPGATETWYDGIDADCGEDDDFDADGDGWPADEWGGSDCDDSNGAMNPGASEACAGVDVDCDGNVCTAMDLTAALLVPVRKCTIWRLGPITGELATPATGPVSA